MKTLVFEGYSDDTFACTGPKVYVDCDNCASGTPIWIRVESGQDAMIVTGHYGDGPNAGWSIGVSPADHADHKERDIPAWPTRFDRSERPYSPRLIVHAPDDVKVFLVDAEGRAESRDYIDI